MFRLCQETFLHACMNNNMTKLKKKLYGAVIGLPILAHFQKIPRSLKSKGITNITNRNSDIKSSKTCDDMCTYSNRGTPQNPSSHRMSSSMWGIYNVEGKDEQQDISYGLSTEANETFSLLLRALCVSAFKANFLNFHSHQMVSASHCTIFSSKLSLYNSYILYTWS